MDNASNGSSDSNALAGKVAVVTGGSRGIGLAIAQELVSQGARVIITARGQENLDAAVSTMPRGSALGIAGKAHDPEHRAHVLNTAAQEFGGLDILINNAGINPVYGKLEDLDLGAASKIFEVNVLAQLAWVQAALKHPDLKFRERKGSVVNLSSVAGETPPPGIGFYGVTKAAVSHLTRTLAVELGPDIRVNAVAPAVVKTDFAKALYEGKEEEVASAYPMARLGVPADIAQAVAFLVSDNASWITAQVLLIDGGLTAAGGTA